MIAQRTISPAGASFLAYSSGLRAAYRDAESGERTANPHPVWSEAHKEWARGYSHRGLALEEFAAFSRGKAVAL